jgi:hypothetical protein
MTPRSVAIQGGLAFLALVAAYTTWQRAPELTDGEVFLIDVTKNDLEKDRFEDLEGKSWSELGKAKDAEGTYVTLRLSGYDNSGLAMPSGHPGIPMKMAERLVRANENAGRLFERFSPMRASRALGVLDPGRLKELGLDESGKKFLEITARGIKRRFAVAPAPAGGSDPYVRDLQDNKVYIIARPMLSDMQSASSNLVERRLHGFRMEDLDRVAIDAGGKKRELVATRIEDLPGVRLAPAETPDKPDPTLKNWHDKIFALFPSDVLGKDEVPASGTPVVALRLDYSSRGRPLGFVEIARGATSAVSTGTPTPAAATEVYARSEFTLGWIRLNKDAPALLAEGEALLTKK